MKEVIWSILEMTRDAKTGFVLRVHWSASILDGKHVGSTEGFSSFIPVNESRESIEYSQLTEVQVINWVRETVSEDGLKGINESINLQISELKEPAFSSGLPW